MRVLSRVITRSSLVDIKEKISIKAIEYKTNVYTVAPNYTSKRCNSCGHISKDNRLTQHQFKCIECGHEDNADVNASLNIRDKFLNIW